MGIPVTSSERHDSTALPRAHLCNLAQGQGHTYPIAFQIKHRPSKLLWLLSRRHTATRFSARLAVLIDKQSVIQPCMRSYLADGVQPDQLLHSRPRQLESWVQKRQRGVWRGNP